MGVDSGTALVTGASRGIGRAVALELASRGLSVVATVRRAGDGADLGALGDGRIAVVTMDVTDPSSYVIPDDLRILVNNAGADGDHVPVEHADLDTWRAMFDTNLFGMVALTKAAIPALRANAPSVVATITSSSILMPVPFYAGYRATKAAASAVCDSLRVELAPFGVRVVEILPGPVATDMFAASLDEPEAARFDDYRAMAEHGAATKRATADPMVEPVDAAARMIVDALLADGGPMRYSCDPLGIGLLDLWRTSDDETLHAMMTGGVGDTGA
jgi:NAD(P)-dependent dehydrogenase (short-subunit alcohol dehydrogenase family)